MSNLSREENQAKHRVYVDPDLPFSIHVPNGWLLDTSRPHNTAIMLFYPEVENHFRANVNVVANELTPLTHEEYLTLSRLELKRFARLPSLPIDQPDPNSENCHFFEWTTDQQPISIKTRQRIIFGDKHAFVVTATASLKTFEKHRPQFEVVLSSFALTDPK